MERRASAVTSHENWALTPRGFQTAAGAPLLSSVQPAVDATAGTPANPAKTPKLERPRLLPETVDANQQCASCHTIGRTQDAGEVAVGTAVAGGPPRRSQRMELPYWAPASDFGVEASVGPGMQDA